MATVLPVEDMEAAVSAWKTLLGAEPTFVDGDRWAQFDFDGKRIALAGADRTSDKAGVMLKVADLAAATAALTEAGCNPGEVQEGPHEFRVTAEGPGGWPIVIYTGK
jgi:hypothetical protein